MLQAPVGVEEVQDYTFKLHVAKGCVAREEFSLEVVVEC